MKGIAFAFMAFAVFSLHDVFVKLLSQYSVFQIVFFAMLFGYVPFSIIRMVDARAISLRPVHPWLVTLRAALMVLGMCSAFMAFTLLPMVEVYVLIFMTPLLIVLMAIPILGERIHRFRWLTIMLGMLGIIIVLRPSPDTLELGHLFGAIAAVGNAGAAVIARKVGHEENVATLMLAPMILTILVSGVMLYFVYQPMPLGDLSLMFLIGLMGLVGQGLLLAAYRSSPASMIAPMQYSQLIWAIIYGAVFFQDSVDNIAMAGAAITILSGVLMVYREARVSQVQPIIRTRNMRMMSTAPIPNSEKDV